MVPLKGFEPPTHALRMRCSTPELQRQQIKRVLLRIIGILGNGFNKILQV